MQTPAAILLLAILGLTNPSSAIDCTEKFTLCDHCGCYVISAHQTCQVVCEMKKETKTRWYVECEEFCPLMPGHRECGDECQTPLRCGNPKCVKRLVKKEYQTEVPVYKCIVRNLCPDCCQGEAPTSVKNTPSAAPASKPKPLPTLPTPPDSALRPPK